MGDSERKLFIPLTEMTRSSSSSYTDLSAVHKDIYVDANNYLEKSDENGQFVLKSVTEFKVRSMSEDFVETVNNSREQSTWRKYFFKNIYPKLREKTNLKDISNFLRCKDQRLQTAVLIVMREARWKINLDQEGYQDIEMCLDILCQYLESSDQTTRPDLVVSLICDLSIIMKIVATMQHEHRKSINDLLTKYAHSFSKMCKTDKRNKWCRPGLHQLKEFMQKCSNHRCSKRTEDVVIKWKEVPEESAFQVTDPLEVYMILSALLFKVSFSRRTTAVASLFRVFCEKWIEKQKNPGVLDIIVSDLISRGIVQLIDKEIVSVNETSHLLTDALKMAMSGNSPFTELPYEVQQLLLTTDKSVLVEIWRELSLSEYAFQRLTMKVLQCKMPGLFVHGGDFSFGMCSPRTNDKTTMDRRCIGKSKHHSVWLLTNGSFMEDIEVTIKTCVPGISPTTLDVKKDEEIGYSNTLNEFEVLRVIQSQQQHRNIAQMVAYSSGIPMAFVVEEYEKSLRQRLYFARETTANNKISTPWMVGRCLDMVHAISYLHFHGIIHRDIMTGAFAIRCHSVEPEVAVLTSFSKAIFNDKVGTYTVHDGHVRDLSSSQLLTRWSAPESLIEDRFDEQSDVWMIGHAIREVFTLGCQPYTEMYSEETGDIMAKVIFCNLQSYKWECIPKDVHLLTTQCTHIDPKKRPSLADIIKILSEIRRNIKEKESKSPQTVAHIRRSRSFDYPHFGGGQSSRNEEPERGVPKIISDLKKVKENARRETYVELNPNTRKSNEIIVTETDLTSEDAPSRRQNIHKNNMSIKELVSKSFIENALAKMSDDFCQKMSILTPPKHLAVDGKSQQGYSWSVDYECPIGKNILELACTKSTAQQHLQRMLALAKLMAAMHEKHWLMIDVCGRNMFINTETNKAFMPRIGRMLRLPLPYEKDYDTVKSAVIYRDRIYWSPIEVIRHSEYSQDSDVYMLAMVFYEYYTAVEWYESNPNKPLNHLKCVPFPHVEINKIISHLTNGEIPMKPRHCPLWLYEDIMKQCWTYDRTLRPSINTIVDVLTERSDQPNQRHVNDDDSDGDHYDYITVIHYDSPTSQDEDLASPTAHTTTGIVDGRGKERFPFRHGIPARPEAHDMMDVNKENPLFQSQHSTDSGSRLSTMSSTYVSVTDASVIENQRNFSGDSSLFCSDSSQASSGFSFANDDSSGESIEQHHHESEVDHAHNGNQEDSDLEFENDDSD